MENPQKSQESKPQTTDARAKQHAAKFMVIELATEFAFLIAVPLIGLIYLGRWLDSKYHSKLFILGGLFLALAVSSMAIWKRINIIRKNLK